MTKMVPLSSMIRLGWFIRLSQQQRFNPTITFTLSSQLIVATELWHGVLIEGPQGEILKTHTSYIAIHNLAPRSYSPLIPALPIPQTCFYFSSPLSRFIFILHLPTINAHQPLPIIQRVPMSILFFSRSISDPYCVQLLLSQTDE